MPASNEKINKCTNLEKKIVEVVEQSSIHLPTLPLPDLHPTLDKYLLCVKPLVSDIQFEKTKKIVEKFGQPGGVGEKLQNQLQKYATTQENWAYDWWLKDMYLYNKASLPVNSNPGMVLPKMHFSSQNEYLRYAAKLVAGILDFKIILDAQALPVDVARGQLAGQALCMEQYYRLLNSYRLPGYNEDTLVSFKSNSTFASEHIIVACNGQFFAVNINHGDYRLTEADFCLQFDRILKISENKKYQAVGILTSLERNEWAESRDLLLLDPVNRISLDAIERCSFVLCLDKAIDCDNEVMLAKQMLYGCKPELNSCNRWYDKTIQLIVGPDGVIGLCYEHSASEGIAVTALLEHLLKYISLQEEKGLYKNNSIVKLPMPEHLQWSTDKPLLEFIERGELNIRNIDKTMDLEIFRFTDHGKDFIKQQNISPDAYVQVALQLAYYKLYKQLVATYESGSTRRFQKGRVENIRAATVEVLDLAKNLTDLPDSEGCIKVDAKKMLLLRRAIKTQTNTTIAAITGQGIDCHLLGLKQIAEKMNLRTPEIFQDPAFSISNYFQLSTSQIPTSTDSFMCYGAVVSDGYGVSYNPHSSSIVFCISSFTSCLTTNSLKFVDALRDSLEVMKDICQKWNLRRSSSLELLSSPKKLLMHRSFNVVDSSTNESLREESKANNTTGKKSNILKKQRSLIILPLNSKIQTQGRSSSGRGKRATKLDRRSSDLSINRPLVKPQSPLDHMSHLSHDLVELLRKQNIS